MIDGLTRWPAHAVALTRLLGRAIAAWWSDDLLRLGASLAYYTLFAIAPILLIAVAVAGSVFGNDAVRGEVSAQLRGLMGDAGAEAIEALVEGARWPSGNMVAIVVGSITTILAATGVFLELQTALNVVWRVRRGDESWGRLFRDRAQSFGIVVAIGFLLLVSLTVSAALAAFATWLEGRLPAIPLLLSLVNAAFSLAAATALFALLFKTLPDVPLRVHDVLVGAFVTSLLFTVGKQLIGLYIGQSSSAGSYGAAGSVIVVLLWVYYSSQVLLIGAQFTRLHVASTRPTATPNSTLANA